MERATTKAHSWPEAALHVTHVAWVRDPLLFFLLEKQIGGCVVQVVCSHAGWFLADWLKWKLMHIQRLIHFRRLGAYLPIVASRVATIFITANCVFNLYRKTYHCIA
jgi:hypothetical protein